ncbi:MAG: hypothetical protein ACRDFT_09855 [bacterium]
MLTVAGALVLAAVALAVVVAHHVAYFRGLRAPAFAAFLETAGWLILLLVALGTLSGGLRDPGTARVEAAAGATGVICVAAGWRLNRRAAKSGESNG